MKNTNRLDELTAWIAALDENKALEATNQLICDGVPPLKIIEHSHKGMEEVGLRYEKGEYFISGLIMAGEIMQQISHMVVPLSKTGMLRQEAGTMVVGTVEGDIHFIGKDIFKSFLRGHGFQVHDLGVDVPKERFLSAVYEFRPDIVGFSCLINSGHDALGKTIAYLREKAPAELAPLAYLVGGRRITEKVGKTVGADLWTSDSMEGVRLCQRTMKTETMEQA